MKQATPNLAKITKPFLYGVFPRKRLFHILDEGRKRPIIWVAGPPGSGKTSLVCSYLYQSRLPCLWYQVDDGDKDIASFFYYMGIAGKKAAPGRKKRLPLLSPEYLPDIPTFTKRYFEDLYSRLNLPNIIVFDNYQDVPEESLFHEVIRQGMSMLPQGINIIVISRSGPPSLFMRLKANGVIGSIEWDDLRFTYDELSEILLSRGMEMSSDIIKQIYDLTDGWAAGIVLLLERMKREGDRWLQYKGWSRDEFFGYFAKEIFETTNDDVQDFLLKTALLPDISPARAEELTSNTMAGSILSELSRKGYFIFRLPRRGVSYRYHPLFREFLIYSLNERFSDDEVVRLKRTAAKALESEGRVEDAVRLFCEIKDWDGITEVLLRHAQPFLEQGRCQTVGQWLESLPKRRRERNPWLLFWYGNCRLPLDPGEARSCFEKAYRLFKASGDRAGMFLSWAGAVDAVNFELSDCSVLDPLIDDLETVLQKDSTYPSPEVEARVTYAMFLALVIRRPAHPAIKYWEQRAESLAIESPDINLRIQSSFILTMYRLWTGDFSGAGMIVNMLRGWGRHKAASPLIKLLALTTEAMYHWLNLSPSVTIQKVHEGLELACETGVHVGENMLLEHGVAAALSIGDHRTAEDFLQKLSTNLHMARLIDMAYYRYLVYWQALLQDDIHTAFRYASTFEEITSKLGLMFGVGLTMVSKAQALCAQGRYHDAGVEISRSYKLARRMKSSLLEFMTGVVDTTSALDQGQEERALNLLKKTMLMGKEQEYFNFFGWCPTVMTRLCVKALEAGIEVEYVQTLIRKRQLIPPSPPLEVENWPYPLKIFTMGRFSIVIDGIQKRFSGKAQKRPLEMFKAIVSLGGRNVSEDYLADLLYPEADGDMARQSFATTLHRLRKLIGTKEAILRQDGQITIDPRYCWVDTWAFERIMGEIDSALQESQTDSTIDKVVKLANKALKLYQGPFLKSDTDRHWTLSCRERLRSKFLRVIGSLGRYLHETGAYEQAIACYMKGLEADNLAEDFYQGLMRCYKSLGRQAEGIAVYRRCRKTLSTILGIEPSPETETIYRRLYAN